MSHPEYAYTSEIVLGLFFHFSLQAAEVTTAQEAAGKNVGHIYINRFSKSKNKYILFKWTKLFNCENE